MKKFLLSLLTVLAATTTFAATQDEVFLTAGAWNNNSSYTSSSTTEQFFLGSTWTQSNFNNNNNAWDNIRCGRKNNTSVASIVNTQPLTVAISKIVVNTTYEKTADKGKLNSVNLLVSSSKEFPQSSTTTIPYNDFSTDGDWTFVVPQEAITVNLYYKLEFDCQSASNNGFLGINYLTFTPADNGGGDEPTPGPTAVSLSFPQANYSATLGEAFEAPELTWNPADAIGEVEYTSSNTGVATVDASTGDVTIAGAGQTEISVAFAGNDNYKPATAKYTLTVTDPNSITTELTSTFFGASSYNVYTKTDETTNITYAAGIYNGSNTMQLNNNSSRKGCGIVVTSINENFNIKSIDIEITTPGKGINVYSKQTAFATPVIANAISTDGATKINSEVVTSSGSFSINAPAFAIIPESTGQINISKVTVHYEKTTGGDGSKVFTTETFKNYTIEQDDMVELVLPENAPAITFTSSDATVAEVEDGYILAYKPGIATITATWDAVPNVWKAGSASFTVTVPTPVKTYDMLFSVVTEAQDKEKIIAVGDFEVIYKSGANTIVTDGLSNILLYGYNVTAPVGTKISKIEATVTVYYGLFELTDVTLTEGGEGAQPDVHELTTLEGINYDDQLFDQIVVKGATITNINGKQGTLNLNGKTIAMYNNFNIDNYANTAEGLTVTVTGFVWRNNNTLQIDPISIVEETGEKIDAQLAWSAEEYTVMEGVDPTDVPTLINPLGIEVVFTSTDENVAIYGQGELLTDVAGTAVITALPVNTEKYYGSASFTVTVTPKPQLGEVLLNGKPVADDAVVEVSVNKPVTLSVENAEIVEAEIAGPVDINDIVEGSTYTFTPTQTGEYIVNFTAVSAYEEATSVIFTLKVVDKVVVYEEILDFINNDYGMKRYSGSDSEFNSDGTVLTGTEFTYTLNHRTRLWSTYGLRMYSDGVLTVTAPLGFQIEAFELRNANNQATTLKNIEISTAHHKTTATAVYTATSSNTAIPCLYVRMKDAVAPDAATYSPDIEYITTEPNEDGGINITIEHSAEDASIYYKHTPANAPAQVRGVVSHEGYTAADATAADGKSTHTFTIPSNGTVSYYAYHTATDTKGVEKTISVSAAGEVTSISEIVVDGTDTDAIYDLMGRRIAAPARGLYIKNGAKYFLR